MTFRARLLLGLLLVALVPIAVLAVGVRREMAERLRAQYEQRVRAMTSVVEQDIIAERSQLDARLGELARDMADDNALRAAVHGDGAQRGHLLDYASRAMRLTGLSMLQLQDESGRILSSGHFRQEYDRLEPELPALLAEAPGGSAVVRARAPDGAFLALAAVNSVQIGARTLAIVAGVSMEQRFLDRLARDTTVRVSLLTPPETSTAPNAGGTDSAPATRRDDAGLLTGNAGLRRPRETAAGERSRSEAVAAKAQVVSDTLLMPFVAIPANAPAVARLDTARLVIDQSVAGLAALQRSVERWFLAAAVVVALVAALLAMWLAARLGAPIVELAGKAEHLDLDRLEAAEFRTARTDEVGRLSRTLGAMTSRLRASATRLRDAERRMAVGEVARQVNHDIKNGLAPIRNVLRHLTQVAREEPSSLAGVYLERHGTIEQSVAYLETLAANYAKLSPRSERRPSDANAIASEVVAAVSSRETAAIAGAPGTAVAATPGVRTSVASSAGPRMTTRLAPDVPPVLADPVLLRRILENLVANAVESLEGGTGEVTVETSLVPRAGDSPLVRIIVADTGKGMTERELARAFDDFFTTKPQGTGLGLSIVRRLVADLEGALRVETGPGTGSRFTIELPTSAAPLTPHAARGAQPIRS